jgi:hypothetical protein
LLSAWIIFVAAVPAMSGAGAAFMLASGLLVLAARVLGPLDGAAGWGLRAIGLLGCVVAAFGLFAVFRAPQTAIFLIAPPMFVVLAAWLPAPSRH